MWIEETISLSFSVYSTTILSLSYFIVSEVSYASDYFINIFLVVHSLLIIIIPLFLMTESMDHR